EPISPARVTDVAKSHFTYIWRHSPHTFSKHRRKTDFCDALMQSLVDRLAPESHARTLERIRWDETWFREDVVKIFANQRGLSDCLSLVDNGWDHAFRVEPKVLGIELFGAEEVNFNCFQIITLLAHHNADFVAAHRVAEIVERDHRPLLGDAWADRGRAISSSISAGRNLWRGVGPPLAKPNATLSSMHQYLALPGVRG